MSQEVIENLTLDVQDLRNLVESATRQRVKDLLLIEIRKLETEITNQKEKIKDAEAKAAAPVATSSKPATPAASTGKRYQAELKEYAWDQSDKFVKIFISVDGIQKNPEESVHVEFTEKTLNLYISDLNNRDYTFVVNNLLESIDVSKSYRKVKTDMVAIYMKKAVEGLKWSCMTLTEKRLKDMKDPKMGNPGDLGDSSDPSAGLMNMMKKMYESGDDNMKRMINKAWAEGQEKRGQDFSI